MQKSAAASRIRRQCLDAELKEAAEELGPQAQSPGEGAIQRAKEVLARVPSIIRRAQVTPLQVLAANFGLLRERFL